MHESAGACPLTRARHAHFIRLHLLTPLSACIAAPLVLAFSGAPAPWQAAAFGVAMLPLAGVALASGRGALAEAQAIGLAALGGLACIAALARRSRFRRRALSSAAAVRGGACVLVARTDRRRRNGDRACAAARRRQRRGLHPEAGRLAARRCGVWKLRARLCAARSPSAGARNRRCATRCMNARAANTLCSNRSSATRAFISIAPAPCCTLRPPARRFSGLRPRDLSGRGFFERVQVADRPVFLKALSDAARMKSVASARLRVRGPDVESERGTFSEPSFRYVDIRARLLSGEGDAATIFTLVRDVTDLVEAELVVAAQKAGAFADTDWKKSAARQRQPRIAHAAERHHRSFRNARRRARHAPSEAQRVEYADIINASGKHLLSIVNALLDVSKMESGRFEISAEPLELPSLVDTCCDIVRLKAQEAKVEIVRDLHPDICGPRRGRTRLPPDPAQSPVERDQVHAQGRTHHDFGAQR